MSKSSLDSQKFLTDFVLKLKERDKLPRRMELSELGSTTIANSFDDSRDYTISEFVFTGVSLDPSTATLKSLVEKIEREAYSAGMQNNLPSCQTERSDGFAAYPIGIPGVDAHVQARANAWNEAFERYVWASWWDQPEISYILKRCTKESLPRASASLLSALHEIIPIKSFFEIVPETNHPDATVSIIYAELGNGGYVSGGAAGRKNEHDVIVYRALSELVRHGLAAFHFKNRGTEPKSFYEKRLHFFAFNPEGAQLLKSRLATNGTSRLEIPQLSTDEGIPHELSDLVYVHRCYFQGQPPFIGGDLKRFCL